MTISSKSLTTSAAPVFSQSKREGGFTLIEVMVALAILAVVAVAASRASSAYLSSVDVLRTRTLAHFVAQNAAADLRIQDTWLTAKRTQTINAQGRDWQVVMTVSEAMTPALKEVNITVAPIIDGQTRNAVTDIDVILSNPEQDIGSLDLGGLGAGIAGQTGDRL
ncbi:type II secretion system minor pseudopilin GspI [Psychrobacter vallis]|uniref:type II secretion system minor pseudopilin GspI n=1 Tax=Psychrobacter vallis TaxID=248451 RepID=UPI0019191BBE|nr:type II secretion system minor pseudopilin GspI [Psychrobacter vallis]